MPRHPRIALIVDHPRRDLAGLLLVAHELCQQGATVYLVPVNLQEDEIWALAPDFVLLNFLRRGNDKFARKLVAAHIQFGVLDTEGSVWPNLDAYTELLWQDRWLLQQTRCVCMWGPHLAAHTINAGLFQPHQVVVTGCPRFDLYHPAWQAVLHPVAQHPAAHTSDTDRQRILINTNFYTVNSRFVTTQTNIAQLRTVFGWSEARIAQIVADEERGIVAMTELARRLALDYPAAQVVLRPHPFEQAARYYAVLGNYANVTVNETGPVQQQIAATDVVIQRSCTTGIEAGIAAVPTLSPHWIAAPQQMPMVEAVSVPCHSYAELHARVGAIFAGTYTPPAAITAAITDVVHRWFYQIDGRAHQRVSATMLAACADQPGVPDQRQCGRYLYGLDNRTRPWQVQAAAVLRAQLGLSPQWSFRQWRTVLVYPKPEKVFTATEVGSFLAQVHATLGAAGHPGQVVEVAPAQKRGDYQHGYRGQALALWCAPPA